MYKQLKITTLTEIKGNRMGY